MFDNQVSVVTGGAQDIGYKVVERLFNDGFNIGIIDFNKKGIKKQ